MNVLVTGATGFIGSHTVAALANSGHGVRLLVRSPHKVEPALVALGVDPGDVEVLEGDASNRSVVTGALDGCDAVIHAAATVALTASAAAEARDANTDIARSVLGGAAASGCQAIVHISSLSVFSLDGSRDGGRPITAESALRVDGGGYSRSKTDIEWYARGLIDAGAPVRILYPSGVIGPHAPTLTNVHRAALTWVDRTPLMPSGINLVDVRDVASGAVAALGDGLDADRFVLNAAFVGWADLYDVIEDVTGHGMTRIPVSGTLLRGVGRAFDLARIEPPVPFPLTGEAMTEATRARPADGGTAAEQLGLTYRDLRSSVEDSYRWLVEEGHVPVSRAPRLAP